MLGSDRAREAVDSDTVSRTINLRDSRRADRGCDLRRGAGVARTCTDCERRRMNGGVFS